jgi:hypothetical protein
MLMSGDNVNVAQASSPSVVPVDWGSFTAGLPTDANSQRLGAILQNTNRYALVTWCNSRGYGTAAQQAATYLDLGGNAEGNIRPPASEALALAVSLRTGGYDPAFTTVELHSATTKAAKLVRSLAFHHKVNISGGWGDAWQSGLWAAYAGMAGWLMWDSPFLTSTDLKNIRLSNDANEYVTADAVKFELVP